MSERVSGRQLRVAAFTGLLAPAAAVNVDWRGALLAVPAAAAVMALSARAGRGKGLTAPLKTGWGRVVSLLYIVWGLLAAGTVLALCGQRLARSTPNQAAAGGFVLLVILPVLWLTVSKGVAFARAGEIFYLAMAVVLAVVLAAGAVRVEPWFLLAEGEGIPASFGTAFGLGCLGIYALLLWDGQEEQASRRWLRWSGAAGLALTLMAAVTVGSLSPALAGQTEQPFFLMTVGLSRTARMEGLVTSLWLLADVTFVGVVVHADRHLLKEVWKVRREKTAACILTVAALGVCYSLLCIGNAAVWMERVIPVGGAVLGGVFPLLWTLFGAKKRM